MILMPALFAIQSSLMKYLASRRKTTMLLLLQIFYIGFTMIHLITLAILELIKLMSFFILLQYCRKLEYPISLLSPFTSKFISIGSVSTVSFFVSETNVKTNRGYILLYFFFFFCQIWHFIHGELGSDTDSLSSLGKTQNTLILMLPGTRFSGTNRFILRQDAMDCMICQIIIPRGYGLREKTILFYLYHYLYSSHELHRC